MWVWLVGTGTNQIGHILQIPIDTIMYSNKLYTTEYSNTVTSVCYYQIQ